ncbi:MAG: DUF3368 domain-containing protein [Chloroflexi bacterium]|nr:MAG: DUF3368 domain-containing protein [Chloroflexota bacterium]
MSDAISNTSPLLYLYRIGKIELLPRLFDKIFTVPSVADELQTGHQKGYDVPLLERYHWLEIVSPKQTTSEWLARDLGKGELETIALALERQEMIVLLDDGLARRIAQAAGIEVWGTLRVLLEAKNQGLLPAIAPLIDDLSDSGMWISADIKRRILSLAGE